MTRFLGALATLAATAAAWAPLRRPLALRTSPKHTVVQATNADWRTRCDTEGVVSYYDFGVRLGGAAPAAAGDSKAVATSGSTSFSPVYAARETIKYVGATAVQYKLLMLALSGVDKVATLPKPAVWLLFAFLSLRSRVVSLLDNSRPNREEQKGKATPMDVKRPSWTPPGIAFPFIWLTITALRATAAQMAYAGSLRAPALDALVLHLCIGDTWNCITNVERRLGVSAIGCFAVWGSVFRAVKAFGASSAPKAAYVLAPSLAWISVACVLTASIWNLNGRPPVYPAAGDGDSADLRLKYLLQMEATSIRGGK